MSITIAPQADWSKLAIKQTIEGDTIRVTATVPVQRYRITFPARDAQR